LFGDESDASESGGCFRRVFGADSGRFRRDPWLHALKGTVCGLLVVEA
jgi:hypothetical protein